MHRGTEEEARSRRVTDFISFDDPWGNKFDLVIGQVQDPSFLELTRPSSGITEFGHICVDAADIVAAAKFWNDNFNVKVSDWVHGAAALMRFNTVHHTLAVFQGDEPGLCHINFQVDTIDALFRNWNFIKEHNVEIEQGPGRHPQSDRDLPLLQGPGRPDLRVLLRRPPHRRRRRLDAPHLRPHDVRGDRHVGRQLPEALHATADPHRPTTTPTPPRSRPSPTSPRPRRRRTAMPIINVNIAQGHTAEQLHNLMAGISRVAV